MKLKVLTYQSDICDCSYINSKILYLDNSIKQSNFCEKCQNDILHLGEVKINILKKIANDKKINKEYGSILNDNKYLALEARLKFILKKLQISESNLAEELDNT